MVTSLSMTLVYYPCLTCIQEGWQYHSLVDFQLGVKLDSVSLPDICTESYKCHNGFCNSGSDLIINGHCSGKSASQVGEFINNFQFLSIHSDGWFIVQFSRCRLLYQLTEIQSKRKTPVEPRWAKQQTKSSGSGQLK